MLNTGDVIFQVFTIALIAGTVSLIILFFKSRNTTKKRIDKLEKEIMELKLDKHKERKR
ncbi:hypothetical protein MHB63_02525 [Bacillus sp. FSL H8-0547]